MNRESITIVVAVILIVLFGVAGYYVIERETNATPASSPLPSGEPVGITDIVPGSGPGAKNGDLLTVHYRGTLADGTEFDSSYSRNAPFRLILGAGEVIRGWEEGLLGMQKGGKRRLVIPPSKGYGAQGQGPIPPNATLAFEVELIEISSSSPAASALPR